MSEHLITSYGSLLKEDGSLREEGYATHLPFVYDKAAVQAPFTRIKEYDIYSIDDENYIVGIGLFKFSIITIIDVQIYNKDTKKTRFAREIIPDPLFRYLLPTHSETGSVEWDTQTAHVKITPTKTSRRLSLSIKNSQEDIEVEALMNQLDEDILINCMKVNDDKRHFHYTKRAVAMPTRGGIRMGDVFHEFTSNCLSSYSWGRGAWNHTRSLWVASGQGIQDGHRVALSLGYGIGDTSKATQNALFIDGKLHKLEHINIGVRRNMKGDHFYSEPWIISDTNKKVSLVFTPHYNKDFDAIQMGEMFEADQCLAFGTYSGSIELEDGTYFPINDLPGSAIHAHIVLPFGKDKKIV